MLNRSMMVRSWILINEMDWAGPEIEAENQDGMG